MKKPLMITAIGLMVAGVTALIFVGALVLYGMLAFARDVPPPNDAHLKLVRQDIPNRDNAFTYLAQATNLNFLGHSYRVLTNAFAGESGDLAVVADVIQTNSRPLALIARAIDSPTCQLPKPMEPFTLLPETTSFRQMGRLMDLQARYEFRRGQHAAAFNTALDTCQFGDMLMDSGGPLIHYLVAVAVKGLGLARLEQMLPAANLESDILTGMADRLSVGPASESGLMNAFRVEYELACVLVDDMQHRRADSRGVIASESEFEKVLPKNHYFFHPNRTKQLFAETCSMMIENAPRPFGNLETNRMARANARETSLTNMLRPNPVGRIIHSMVISALVPTCERKARIHLYAEAVRTLLALKACKQNTGELPATLSELVPGYLKDVPYDPFDGEPLRYDRNQTVLYSVGRNLTDEHGSQWTQHDGLGRQERWRADDIVFPIRF